MYDYLGHSVAVDGDTVIARLITGDAAPGDGFGYSVDIGGGTIVADAYYKTGVGLGASAAYVCVLQTNASATFGNAGGNPASQVAVTLPVIGTAYTATVDLGGTTEHSFACLVGYSTPLTLPLGSGPVLLVSATDPHALSNAQDLIPGL